VIVTLHLCAPQGEVLRQQLSNILNQLKQDNRYVINAMLGSGLAVPDTVIDADLEYVPSRHRKNETGEPMQVYYGMRSMFDTGTFSCAEAAAFEAAVLEEKYGEPTECISVDLGDGNYHAIFVTKDGEVDPTENYLRHWEQQLGMGSTPVRRAVNPKRRAKNRTSLGAVCQIVDGRVACDIAGAGSCVDVKRGVWRSSDRKLNGKRAQLADVGRGWARTKTGVFVPTCGGR